MKSKVSRLILLTLINCITNINIRNRKKMKRFLEALPFVGYVKEVTKKLNSIQDVSNSSTN